MGRGDVTPQCTPTSGMTRLTSVATYAVHMRPLRTPVGPRRGSMRALEERPILPCSQTVNKAQIQCVRKKRRTFARTRAPLLARPNRPP
jgi:hypothetical protein